MTKQHYRQINHKIISTQRPSRKDAGASHLHQRGTTEVITVT